jgi:hypothetical protein
MGDQRRAGSADCAPARLLGAPFAPRRRCATPHRLSVGRSTHEMGSYKGPGSSYL